MHLPVLTLKKDEDRRLRAGHLWIYSNEIAELPKVTPGESVLVRSAQGRALGVATVNPHSLIAARIFSTDLEDRLDADFISRRLSVALQSRSQIFEQPYYRLCFAEGDLLPGLIVDRYGPHLVVQITTAAMEAHKSDIIEALKRCLSPKSILFKNDSAVRTLEGLEPVVEAAYGTTPARLEVWENGMRFEMDPWQGQKTGWFFDHRLNRARLAPYVPGKRVLDVCSYVGAWALQAAAGGAASVHAIDSSAAALSMLQDNAADLGMSDKLTLLEGDAFDQLSALPEKAFDVVILDPPAFIKRRKDIPTGTAAYQRLHHLALARLAPGGILVSASCSLHLEAGSLMNIVRKASVHAQRPVQILEQGHQGPDHPIHPAIPETGYLKCIIARVLS